MTTNTTEMQTMLNSNLETTVAKTLKVDPQRSVLPGKIGTPEFEKELLEEFIGKNTWRRSTNLSTKLKVDAKELEKFLDSDKRFTRKLGDNESVLYATTKRVEEESTKVKKTQTQITIKPQDRFALASIRMIEMNLKVVLDKYGLQIYEQNEEILSHLTKAMKSLSSAKVLLAQETYADTRQLI